MDKNKLRKLLIGDFSVKRLIRSFVFVYVSILLFAYFFSDRLMFPARPTSYSDDRQIIKIRTENSRNISAIYLSNPNAEFTIFYNHGNAEDIGYILDFLEIYRDQGFSVFAYDYEGYGTSGGRASEKNTYKDADAAYEYLVRQLKVSPERIIIHGRSVGGGLATYLASRQKVAGLILESSFVTAFRVVTRIPLLPFDKFKNIDRIKKIYCPVFVIHGRSDRIVPFRNGEKLFEAANEPKLKLWVDGAGHNDLVMVADDSYWDAIKRFTDLIRNTQAKAEK
jgi:hypothetical protein